MNDLAIFNDDYFDFDDIDDASEGTTAKRVITNASALAAIIYEFIHNANIKKSVVVDVDAMIANGLSKEKAMKDAKKAIKFFKDNKYLAYDVNPDAGKLFYKSLNEDGKRFVNGFYDKMDKITPFSIEKAIDAKKYGRDASSSKIAFAINTAKCILLCIGMGVSGSLIVLILSTIAFAGAYSLMIKYSVDIGARYEFDNAYIKESSDDIFATGYFEDYIDDIIEEDVDTFDENYLEAMEGNKDNKDRKNKVVDRSKCKANSGDPNGKFFEKKNTYGRDQCIKAYNGGRTTPENPIIKQTREEFADMAKERVRNARIYDNASNADLMKAVHNDRRAFYRRPKD